MKNSWLRLTGGVLALILFAGCASTPEPAPAEGPWTPSELSFALSGNDPVEGFNRSMFAVTDFGMEYVVDPLGRVYTSILPRPAIEKFNNLCVNLEFPARAFSCLGRAEFGGAWDELCRFLINTTVGIAGLFDPAGAWFDIYSTESDFGQMFAAWGIGPGCTFILPFMASLNVRDGVGSIFDMAFDIKTYIPYAGYATALNRMVVAHRAYEKAVNENPALERLFGQEQAQAVVQMNLNAKNYSVAAEPMSNIYGALYSTLATDDPSQRKSMRYIGSCIGRVFYLLDKASRVEKDRKVGRYNVFLVNGINEKDAAMENAQRQALAAANDLVRAYGMLDVKLNKSLIDNIMILGLRHAVDPLDAENQPVRWELP